MDAILIRTQLESFVRASFGEVSRPQVPRHLWQWQHTFTPELEAFVWQFYDDRLLPRAMGLRFLEHTSREPLYEAIAWYSAHDLRRSHWRLLADGRWSAVSPERG